MKKAISIIVATLLLASLVFMPGCKQYTVYEEDHIDSNNTVTFYEFTRDIEVGEKITIDMLKEIKVDLNATAFVTSSGRIYSIQDLSGFLCITPDNITKEITEDCYCAVSVKNGDLFIASLIIDNSSVAHVECIRLKQDITSGTQITANHLEIISVPAYALPTGIYRTAAEVIGKYAKSELYAGDYITPSQLSDIAPTMDNIIGEGKQVVSVQISSFAGSLSGKLKRGDIVSFGFRNENGEPHVPEELQYVMVIKDQIIVNDDGSFSMPATVTVMVSEAQAKLLADLDDSPLYLTLVYRGNEEEAEKYLDMQDDILKQIEGSKT